MEGFLLVCEVEGFYEEGEVGGHAQHCVEFAEVVHKVSLQVESPVNRVYNLGTKRRFSFSCYWQRRLLHEIK